MSEQRPSPDARDWFAEVRRAWWSAAAAERVRVAIAAGAVDEPERAWLVALLAEADEQRRRRLVAPLAWILYLGGACLIIPPLIFLGAPHLLDQEAEDDKRVLEEEVQREAVYLPPPPEVVEPDEEPVLIPEEVTGPVRPTAPGQSLATQQGLPVRSDAIGVIGARTDPAMSQPTWLQAFQGEGGGGDGDEAGGQGIPAGMIYVAGGAFSMGSPPGVGEPHERPRHRVELSPYAIDRDEVSVGAFARWCNASDQCGWSFSATSSMMADHPVTGVTWHEARAFCRHYGKDLPTEAQWEMAARIDPATGEGGSYPWGDAAPSCGLANFVGCGELRSRALGVSTGLSPVGARDMSGNAREWTLDVYGPYPVGRQVDPRGPASGAERVLRGGSFGGDPEDIRATDRDTDPPDKRSEYNGFRCAVAVVGDPPPAEDAPAEE